MRVTGADVQDCGDAGVACALDDLVPVRVKLWAVDVRV
jgi:hypothetical protein